MTIKINDIDFTSYFTPYGVQVGHEIRTGTNAGMTISGDTIADEIAYKAIVKLTCMPLTETQLKALFTQLFASQYPTLYYYDTWKGAYRKITATRTVTESTYKGRSITGDNYWTGTEITFTEV